VVILCRYPSLTLLAAQEIKAGELFPEEKSFYLLFIVLDVYVCDYQ
jgi:hypothetical protein